MIILAFLAFALAVVFHGFGFDPNAWFDWQGLALIGFLLLTLDPAWARAETLRKRPAA